MHKSIEELMATRKFCYYIPEDAFVEGHGYRVSVVFENEPGHYPTGDWPYEGKPSQKMPWFWGDDLEFAKKCAKEENTRLGITEEEAFRIVTSSMGAQNARRRR